MALFNKLFFSTNKRKTQNTNQSQHYLSQFPFDTNQVRVLLYRECDNRGRRLLFDSSSIQKMDARENASPNKMTENVTGFDERSGYTSFAKTISSSTKISDEFSYKHSNSTSDVINIGEMIFGALAMSFRGTSLKVHWLQSPVRILYSQVFLSPISSGATSSRKRSKDNSGQSLPDAYSTDNSSMNSFVMPFSVCINRNLNHLANLHYTIPLDVPYSETNTENSLEQSVFSTGDSGFNGWTASVSSYYQYSTRSSLGSVFDDQESFRKLSIDSTPGEDFYAKTSKSSNGNLQRRISRNISTSFENRSSNSDFIGFIGDNCQTVTKGGSDGCVSRFQKLSDKENLSNPEIIRQRRSSGETSLSVSRYNRHLIKRAKLGLAVCITMTDKYENEMEQFCCEHIALLETMLCRLRASAENAYINHRNFLQIMLHAWQTTAQWLTDLFTAPRLPCPVWSTFSNYDKRRSKTVADAFMKELCWLLSFADTKDTNFFISKILTAVLTNHLGWVTIISSMKSKIQTVEAENVQDLILNEVSQRHPYNALWAQIGDLYGAIGNPPKISRTIIYGKEKNSVERLLNVLTYFIRCGEIRKVIKSEDFNKNAFNEIINKQKRPGEVNEEASKPRLTRSRTCVKNLGEIILEENQPMQSKLNGMAMQKSLVGQELRTDADLIHNDFEEDSHESKIRLTLTSPDNIEIQVDSTTFGVTKDSDVIEAPITEASASDKKPKSFSFKEFSWSSIKDGLTWPVSQNIHNDIKFDNCEKAGDIKVLQKSSSAAGNLEESKRDMLNLEFLKGHVSVSDLIPENDVKQFTNGFSLRQESLQEYCEEVKHLEKRVVEQCRTEKGESSGVVFVLGDNEALINLKKSNENLSDVKKKTTHSASQKICSHHKKHSGVKFNFEQYPQIATNYMKNKNLEISNYDFLEKSAKFEEMLKCGPSTSSFAVQLPKSESDSCEKCAYCAGTTTLQTPSNATELEFETNDSYSVPLPVLKESSLNTINMKTAVQSENSSIEEPFLKNDLEQHIKPLEEKGVSKQANLNLLPVPVPSVLNALENDKELKSGFIPSLLVGVSDHYISDMVLQGTMSSPQNWEISLKQDLALVSRCASLISAPTENIAIVADMEKWDVKVVSSQTHSLPQSGSVTSPVGMSQLVSTMLETVQAMSNSGISSCECLSYIESKLQEMYLQSEVLAAFLIATEFCSLNTLTSTLNLSANDVPLLISVASIHSPEVTKKYGVSFR